MSHVLQYIYSFFYTVTFPGILGDGPLIKVEQRPEKPFQKLTDSSTETLTLEQLQSCNPIQYIHLSRCLKIH